jgi:hypothetical protein
MTSLTIQRLFVVSAFITYIRASSFPRATMQSAGHKFAAEVEEGKQFVRMKWAHSDSGKPVTFADAITLFSDPSSAQNHSGREFRSLVLKALRDAPYRDFFWEHPPITAGGTREHFYFFILYSISVAVVHMPRRRKTSHACCWMIFSFSTKSVMEGTCENYVLRVQARRQP